MFVDGQFFSLGGYVGHFISVRSFQTQGIAQVFQAHSTAGVLESSSVDTFSGITICEPIFRGITGTLGSLVGLLVKATGLLASVDCRFFGFVGSRGRHIFNTSPKDQQWSSTNSMSHFFIVSMNGVSILNGNVLHPYLAV